MKLLKNPLFPSLLTDRWIPDFFENERFFDSDWLKNVTVPSVNIRETEKEFFVELAAPGLQKGDFKIELDNNVLTVSSEKEEEKKEEEKDYKRREFSYSSFSRSFQLPENILADKIDAKYENGVLKLSIPKKEITVSASKKEIKVS